MDIEVKNINRNMGRKEAIDNWSASCVNFDSSPKYHVKNSM